ncbi:1-hydroxycarotenoid 3,4-desaturase CrtD [Salinarimonas soli]|uniref:Phytoene desaturase n=1 Tax=Salinarimonas soli TaxID=1638099 RepID=A0A5B2VGQ5_9HYPH|nr:1-hydroxycarotenoid 3,4-desaturase CrtD [Salinarimonas soli]KAA2238064.1 phytoene desaturase [Salinarimonas soli]
MSERRVVVIGAGMAGLVATLSLAARGVAVTCLERAAAPGGKMREVTVDGVPIDSGPTVLTMRWVFEAILADLGLKLSDHVTLTRAQILARHSWDGGAGLDLFADRDRSRDAIGAFAGAEEARGYERFCADARRIYETLRGPFIEAPSPSLPRLVAAHGIGGLPDLLAIRPFTGLWSALGGYFRDPRLRQLFGRYATYCGSSPFRAPATLMLVAHVENEGVSYVEGGMHRLAQALAGLAQARGARLRYGTEVRSIDVVGGRVAGVTLADGERIACDAVVAAGDVAGVAAGLLGERPRRAVPRLPRSARSLSALTWSMRATAGGFPLVRHNVFFSRDYAAEFDDIDRAGRLPGEPTVYVCAQDRTDEAAASGPERLFCLVNAPARADEAPLTPEEIERCRISTFALLARQGLSLEHKPEATVTTGPAEFARLFPGTGGALYGRASHGWRASFQRPGSRTRLPGLYLAGGSVHPGPGVPMAALSGRSAASSILADFASTSRFPRTAMSGGTSTPSATTGGTG